VHLGRVVVPSTTNAFGPGLAFGLIVSSAFNRGLRGGEVGDEPDRVALCVKKSVSSPFETEVFAEIGLEANDGLEFERVLAERFDDEIPVVGEFVLAIGIKVKGEVGE
jgi:hypothetical protein